MSAPHHDLQGESAVIADISDETFFPMETVSVILQKIFVG